MVMTVNPAANADMAAPFRDEAVYAFRFDTDGDRREDMSFKMRSGDILQISSRTSGLTHAQKFDVYRADHAPDGLDGDVVASGHTNEVVSGESGVRVFAGVVNDPFAGDAAGLEAFKAAFAQGDYKPDTFAKRVNFFHDRSVAAIAIEVPNQLISSTAPCTRGHGRENAGTGRGVSRISRPGSVEGPSNGERRTPELRTGIGSDFW